MDTTGPGAARRSPTLADVLRDGRQCRFCRRCSGRQRWPPLLRLARVLVAFRRRPGLDGGKLLCLSRLGGHRVGPRCRVVDTTEHHHGVRVGRLSLWRTGQLQRRSVRPGRNRARARLGGGALDRELARRASSQGTGPGRRTSLGPQTGRGHTGRTGGLGRHWR